MRAFDAGLRYWRQLPWSYLHTSIGASYDAFSVLTLSATAHRRRAMNLNGPPVMGAPGTGLIIVQALLDRPLDDEHRMLTLHWHFSPGAVLGPQGPFNLPLVAAIGSDGQAANFVVQFDQGYVPVPNTSFSIEVDYVLYSCMSG